MREELTWHHRVNRTLEDRLKPWWGTRRGILLSSVLLLSLLLLTLYHYHDFQGKGTPPTRSMRTVCSPCAPEPHPDYCDMPPNLQFKKVIWFITDGYPLYMQREWLPLYADHSVPFSVAVPGRKWSHTVYTSWFTGMPNVNMLARPIDGDSLFESMRRAAGVCPDGSRIDDPSLPAFALHWKGPTWCPVELIGGVEKAKSELGFVEIDAVTEDLDNTPSPYPSIPINSLGDILEEIAENGQSLIAHTGMIDKAAHYGISTDPDQEHLHQFFARPTLRDFIAKHPDYLLVMSSDHGLSKKGKFHGDSTTKKSANIGTFVFYNPALTGQNMTEIDVVDVLPTFTKYLRGVDIPYYSVGEVRNSYGPGNERYLINALKQNLMQILNAMDANDKEYDSASMEQALNSGDEVQLRNAVQFCKEALFRPVTRPYYQYTLFFLTILALFCVVYWVRTINADSIYRTFAMVVPLCFSFAFFLKSPFHYLMEMNFAYYFGAAASALVSILYSEWKISGYIFLNEGFNLIGFGFRQILGGANLPFFVSLLGIFLSFLEYIHYISQSGLAPLFRLRLSYLLALLSVCNVVYLCVADIGVTYIGGVDFFAGVIFLSLPLACLYIFVAIFRARRNPAASPPSFEPLALSLTSLLLLISNGSPLIALCNFQARQILPCLFAKPPHSSRSSSHTPSPFSLQACAIYVLQQPVWMTWFVWGFVPNLDVDIRGGVVGLQNWNEYPILAASLLGLQKVGVFPLMALHIANVIIPNGFPKFIYFATTIANFIGVHMCFARFSFKIQIESLMVISMVTMVQFAIVVLTQHGGKSEFNDRTPWGFNFMSVVSKAVSCFSCRLKRKGKKI